MGAFDGKEVMALSRKKGTQPDVSSDVIAVRDGESFDSGPLAEYLKGRLEGAEAPLEVLQFPGGHANLTYLLKLDTREYVLRRPPIGPVAKSSHDMGREYRALSVLYKIFPYAPRAFLYCEDDTIIGAPFFVMERKKGRVVRNEVPEAFGGGKDPKVNRILSEILIDTLVQLHAADYASIGLEGIGKPEGFMERQVSGWSGRYDRAMTKEIGCVEDLTGWLAEKLPSPQDSVLLHNDWRLDNMMVATEDPSRVVAVFDWDMCTLGDPLADLGCVMSFWFEEGEGLGGMSPMPSDVPGFMKRKEAIERYGEKSGRDVSKMDFYYVFGLFKMAVVVQQIYYRYAKGQTQDDRFERFEMGTEYLMSLAWGHAQSSRL
jgi:aminoglycoside phosphotransferase (APT) family kinase protein